MNKDSLAITTMRNKRLSRPFLWLLLLAGIIVLILLTPKLTRPEYFSTDDFFPYWAAGRLNLMGENPYDPQLKNNLQIAVSGHGSTAYPISLMLNPPYAVSMVMPFALLHYPLSRLAWLLLSVTCIVVSAQLLWRLYNGSTQKRWIPWLMIIIFGPAISVLEVGQISALILLGLSLFLHFTISRRNDWLAGASLVLVAIKPQVTYIFWLALLFWLIQQRRWKILASSILTALVLTLIAMAFNPSVMRQYLYMAQTGYIPELATPTIGAYLRFFWLGTDKFWLQFIAPVLGALWFLYYWIKHRSSWRWSDHLPVVLLVSQVSAPYTYTYDQVILLPAMIQAIIWIMIDRKKSLTILFALLFITINILDLILHMKLSDFWFIWMAPALFAWYLLIRWQYATVSPSVQPLNAG